jgi:hypothetical protein
MSEAAKALLSRAECEEVIRKLHNNDSDDDVRVINYHISQFSEGYPGFLGDYYRLVVEYHHVSIYKRRALTCLFSLSLLININEAFSSSFAVVTFQGKEHGNELKERSFFVKSLPTCNEKKRAMLQESGIFRKEVKIFEQIIPQLLKYSCELLSNLNFEKPLN